MLELHEKKVIYTTAAIGAALLLVGGLVIFPKYYSIRRVNQSITEARTQLELKYEKTKRLHKSQISLAAAQELVDNLYGRILKKGDELRFILAMESLSDGLKLTQNLTVAPSPRPVQKGLAVLGLNVSVTGRFQDLAEYLGALEKNHYPLSIIDFNFGTGGEMGEAAAGAAGPVTLNIKAEIYVQD